MKEQLNKLRNTMLLIETKGNNTLLMADCIRFVEALINQPEQTEKEEPTE